MWAGPQCLRFCDELDLQFSRRHQTGLAGKSAAHDEGPLGAVDQPQRVWGASVRQTPEHLAPGGVTALMSRLCQEMGHGQSLLKQQLSVNQHGFRIFATLRQE